MIIDSIVRGGKDPYLFAQTNNCGSAVAIGSSCTISLTFTPTAVGTVNALLTIGIAAPGNPISISLIGTGKPNFSLSPASLTFQQSAGRMSSPQLLTLTNLGVGPLTIGIIELYGPHFAQVNNCGNILAAQASCEVAVTFTPSVTSPSSQVASVVVNSGAVTLSVSLIGKTIPADPQLSSNVSNAKRLTSN
jgi:hypothetical protein